MLEHSQPERTNIVYYKRIERAFHRWGEQNENGHAFSFVSLSPMGLLKSFKYHKLYALADYVVEVPKERDVAVVTRRNEKCPIKEWGLNPC